MRKARVVFHGGKTVGGVKALDQVSAYPPGLTPRQTYQNNMRWLLMNSIYGKLVEAPVKIGGTDA